MIAGKGGRSVFGQDTFLEKFECNVLKKPYGRAELDKLIKKQLGSKQADELSDKAIELHEKYVGSKLNEDIKELETKYKDLITEIKLEKGYQKIPLFDKANQSEYINERTHELETAKRESINKTRTQSENRKIYLNGFFKFFKIGHGYYYPALSFETDSSDNSYCMFLGFDINAKRNNPYAPSAVKLRFAIADSRKYIVLSASGDTAKEIERIQARSFQLSTSQHPLYSYSRIVWVVWIVIIYYI